MKKTVTEIDKKHTQKLDFRLEYWSGNAFYGIGKILRKYAGLNPKFPIKHHIQHGVKLYTSYESPFKLKEHYDFYISQDKDTLFLMHNKDHAEFFKKHGIENVKAIGSPVIYMDKYFEKLKKKYPNPKGTIVYPAKSTHNVDLSMAYEEYAEMLDNLPEKYKPIKVSLYYIDILKGKGKPFEDKGFDVVSAGSLFSDKFLYTFFDQSMSCEYSSTNDLLSSSVYYNIYAGLKVFKYGPPVKLTWSREKINENYGKERERSDELCPYKFPIEQVEDYKRQKIIADKELGVDVKLSPKEMKTFFKQSIDRKFKKSYLKMLYGKFKIFHFIKDFIPPIFIKLAKRILKKKNTSSAIKEKSGWFGNYNTWKDAKADCTGYDADNILQKVKTSILQVKNGDAVYERDSVIFDKKEYSEDLLKGILDAAKENKYKLHILDFGGSLGSTYYQNKDLLEHLKEFSWNIVEQENFVKEGKQIFENENLKFYYDIDNCIEEKEINVLLLSSVLQYLETPFDFIKNILKYNFDYIIIDRTSLINADKSRISKQIVPASIYKASYPIHFFNEEELLKNFELKYSILKSFNSFCDPENYQLGDNLVATWKGFILKLKK